MLSSIDKSLHGAETGELSKAELSEALEAFFLVGQPGGKTLHRMEEIMQARPPAHALHCHKSRKAWLVPRRGNILYGQSHQGRHAQCCAGVCCASKPRWSVTDESMLHLAPHLLLTSDQIACPGRSALA